jgi:hypothetical protein
MMGKWGNIYINWVDLTMYIEDISIPYSATMYNYDLSIKVHNEHL